MAINIQYPGSIAAMGQVAIQGGEYAGQQQSIQNQLAFGNLGLRQQQLQQQGQQFNADMNFRRNAMLFNDYQQQRNFAQQAQVNRESQIRGIQGNLISQQMANQNREQYQARQFAFGASQDVVQFEQRKELLDLQNEAAMKGRDADFKRQKEAAQFEDELTRERFEYQYSFQQQKEMEKYENALHEIQVSDSTEEEKKFATNQVLAKMRGIQPTPRALQQEFPEGKGMFEVWEDGDWYWTRDQNGVPINKVEKKRPPDVQVNMNDGSWQSMTPDGKIMTHSPSPFSADAYDKEFSSRVKLLQSATKLDDDGNSRNLTIDEINKDIDNFKSGWESRKQKYITDSMNQFLKKRDAEVLSRQQRIDSLSQFNQSSQSGGMYQQPQYQSSPGRSEMITSQSNQPSQSGGMYQQPQQGFHLFPSHMRFDPQNPMQGPKQPKWNDFLRMPEKQQKGIINAVNHLNKVGNGQITRKEADSLNIASPITRDDYEMIPDGVPWFNPYNGRTAVKGTLEDKGFNEFDSEYARKKILQKASKFAELNNPFARVSTE